MSIAESLIEKHRHINVEHVEWWDSEYECFKQDMAEVGIEVDNIYFSGFWSQGDGACFEGKIDNLQLFIDKHFKPNQYIAIRKLMEHGGSVYLTVKHRGHYYHENSTCFSVDCDNFADTLDQPTETHEQVATALDMALTQDMIDFESESVAIFKGYMKKLYRDLERDYDHLTSDKAVKETIEANNLQEIDDGDSQSVL